MSDDPAKIVDLRGAPVEPEPSEPDPAMIRIFEEALERVRSGRVVGCAALLVLPTANSWDTVVDWRGPRLSLLAAACRLQHRMNLAADETTDLTNPNED